MPFAAPVSRSRYAGGLKVADKKEICVVETRNPLVAGIYGVLLAIGAAVAARYILDWLQKRQKGEG